MTLYPLARKACAALVVAAPLTLVACGAGDVDESAQASAEKSTVTSTTDAEESENPETEERSEDAEEDDAAPAPAPASTEPEIERTAGDNDPAAAEAAGAELAASLDENTEVRTQAPVRAGAPADGADVAAINDLVGGAYEQTTLRGWVSYIPNNSCQALLNDVNAQVQEQYGTTDILDFSVIPETPLSEVPQYTEAQATLQSVDNVAVDGAQASADVTVNSGGQTDTSTMRFLREGDRWTFCSDEYAS
ncbi:hypothetical protein [Corynebacterium maris]|uniref:hypothetical protein n=1 Tax=Corynebacterium maris TaxID=575200 RepID=UPI0005A2A116|nr:hypothetical protein [Corynebacterium maris]